MSPAVGRIGFHLAAVALAALAALRLAGIVHVAAWVLGAAALGLALVLFAALYLPWFGLFGRPLRRGPAALGLVARTFDDGPDAAATPVVLAALQRRGHRATFFVIGTQAAAAPEVIRAILAAGCTVGNHTHRHSWLTPCYGPGRLREELERATAALVAAGGEAARPRFVRPPVGLLGPYFAPAAAAAGLRLVACSGRAGDASLWPLARERVLRRVARALQPGAIIALHDGAEVRGRSAPAPALIEAVLDLVEAKGLRSVTLEELCATSPGPSPSPAAAR
ncbi:MAG: polysaccharide deacetylase family protein [Deltaproteobacteria bacterium]|nr:polysaccharide deacetylase family protein [Deltaproteobacteria bacterium]